MGGDLTLSGNVSLTNTSSATNGYIYLAQNTDSEVTITGNTTVTNSAVGGTNKSIYLGNNGDVTFDGTLDVVNSASATTSQIWMANVGTSEISVTGNATFTNSGTGTTTQMYLGQLGKVTFEGTLDLINNSGATNSEIGLNSGAGSANVYNGNVVLKNTSGYGIYFGKDGGEGELADGKTITILDGDPDNFSSGQLYFRNFTQTGTTAQSLELASTANYIYNYDSDWGGNVVFAAPRISSTNTTYKGTSSITKTGAGNDNSPGGNTYEGNVTFTQAGSARWRLSNDNSLVNIYKDDATFVKTGAGDFQPAYSGINTFAGDINIDVDFNLEFCEDDGSVEFNGAVAQSVNDIGSSGYVIIERLIMNNTNDELTLNMPCEVQHSLTMTEGNIITTSTNIITVNDNATTSDASDASFVAGPMIKSGGDDFVFPIGDGAAGFIGEVGISNITVSADYSAEYTFDHHNKSGNYRGGLAYVSGLEFWDVSPSVSSGADVTLYFTDVDRSGITDCSDLVVAHYDGSDWGDFGNDGCSLTGVGYVTADNVTSFSPFTFGSLSSSFAINPLPVEFVDFEGNYNAGQVDLFWLTATELNNDYFVVERSLDLMSFESVGFVSGAGNSSNTLHYNTTDYEPYQGVTYYRLKQVDFDGVLNYSNTISIDVESGVVKMAVYPNPVSGELYIENVPSDSKVSLVNSIGQEIEVKIVETEECLIIDVSSISSGLYIVKLTTQRGKIDFEKIVVE